MNSNSYVQIGAYLAFVQKEYHLQICIKDFYGFIPSNRELDQVLQPYLAHTNSYCMYMKSSTVSYHRCLKMIRKMYEKIEHENCLFFYGTCHAGLGEYVIPIRYQSVLLGTINVGFFQNDEKFAMSKAKHACEAVQGLHFDYAKEQYFSSIEKPSISPEQFLPPFLMLAEYLAHTHKVLAALHPVDATSFRCHFSSEDTILSHAYEYIRQNYLNHISVDNLADFCHCSTSYLSHIFKKRTLMNINTYINRVRIDQSKIYLENSTDTISEIALNFGFSDPNYYSRVFTQIMGISPREYRKRFQRANLATVNN